MSEYLEKNTQKLYLTAGKKNRPGNKIIDLKALVLHWIGPYPNQLPVNTRTWWESESVYGSAHYIIGSKGDILQTLPENEIGYHIGSTQIDPISKKIYTNEARKLFGELVCAKSTVNYYAIGIEMAPISEDGTLSEATLTSARELCVDILYRTGKSIDILTTHNRIVGWKDCPKIFTDYPEKFEQFKQDVLNQLNSLQ